MQNRKNMLTLTNKKLWFIISQLEVGESKLQRARVRVAEKGTKELIGRERLNALITY